MISFPHQLPPLRVGDLVLTAYETGWLRDCLLRAAAEAGHPDWWPAKDVAQSLESYLRNHFNGSAINLSDIFNKLSETLRRIGCDDIASHLRETPPPVSLSLHEIAKDTDSGLELLFFKALHSQLDVLRNHGFQSFRFAGLRSCVKHLRSAKQWRNDCKILSSEIIQFLREHASESLSSEFTVTRPPCEVVITDH